MNFGQRRLRSDSERSLLRGQSQRRSKEMIHVRAFHAADCEEPFEVVQLAAFVGTANGSIHRRRQVLASWLSEAPYEFGE